MKKNYQRFLGKNTCFPLHKFRHLPKQCRQALLHILYPPICLHCREPLDEGSTLFCHHCHQILELICPQERCPYCFSSEYSPKQLVCSECSRHAPILNRIAAAFDFVGPAADLVRTMKYGNRSYLAKGAAAFMAAQLVRLNWPLPDIIIPVPIPLTRWIQRGYNQSFLLAESLAELLDRPVQQALHRSSGDYSQAGLRRCQRILLSSQSFELVKEQKLQDKCLLLIDDVITTGSTLRSCAQVLLDEYPGSIYGLTLCRAIK